MAHILSVVNVYPLMTSVDGRVHRCVSLRVYHGLLNDLYINRDEIQELETSGGEIDREDDDVVESSLAPTRATTVRRTSTVTSELLFSIYFQPEPDSNENLELPATQRLPFHVSWR